jgi:ferredoxin
VRILADREVCIGAGVCVMSTEAVFDQDDDGLVVLLTDEVPVDEEANARKAVQLCPSGALTLAE